MVLKNAVFAQCHVMFGIKGPSGSMARFPAPMCKLVRGTVLAEGFDSVPCASKTGFKAQDQVQTDKKQAGTFQEKTFEER